MRDELDRRERKEAHTIIRGGYADFALMLPQNQKRLTIMHREYILARALRYEMRKRGSR